MRETFTLQLILGALAAIVVGLCLLQRAQSRALRRMQARCEERLGECERAAHELNETLMQGFQGVVLGMQAVMQRTHEAPVRDEIERLLQQADAVLAEGRDQVRYLRESPRNRDDLHAMLTGAGEELSQLYGTAFETRVLGERRAMQPVAMDEIYRIAREALSNAFVHAKAKRITAEIDYGPSTLTVRVRDDGKGIGAETLEASELSRRHGLTGMRERAKRIDGKLDILSGPGAGTQVTLEVPARSTYL